MGESVIPLFLRIDKCARFKTILVGKRIKRRKFMEFITTVLKYNAGYSGTRHCSCPFSCSAIIIIGTLPYLTTVVVSSKLHRPSR